MIVKINFTSNYNEIDRTFEDIKSVSFINDQYIIEDIFGETFYFDKKFIETIVIG